MLLLLLLCTLATTATPPRRAASYQSHAAAAAGLMRVLAWTLNGLDVVAQNAVLRTSEAGLAHNTFWLTSRGGAWVGMWVCCGWVGVGGQVGECGGLPGLGTRGGRGRGAARFGGCGTQFTAPHDHATPALLPLPPPAQASSCGTARRSCWQSACATL